MINAETRQFLRRMTVSQCLLVTAWGAFLGIFSPSAVLDGITGAAVVALGIVASSVYALGGGALGAQAAAFRALAAVFGRWALIASGLALVAVRDGAVVWAVAAGAVLAQAAYVAAASTFKRV